MLAMKFSEKLKRLCGQRRWGQSNLLEFVPRVTKSTMSNWFSGKYKPDLDSALSIARALEVPLDWLADEEAGFPPPEPESPAEPSAILKLVEALRLSETEALRRLASPSAAAQTPQQQTYVPAPATPKGRDLLPPPEGRLARDTAAIQNLDESDARRRYEQSQASREAIRKKEPEGGSSRGGPKRGPRNGTSSAD